MTIASTWRSWLWVLTSVTLVSFAQLALKSGMQHLPSGITLSAWPDLFGGDYWLSLFIPVGLGLLAYCVSVLCWIIALTRLPLSLAYPLLSSSYLLVYVGAMFLPTIQESDSRLRFVGIVLVIVGITFVAWPNAAEKQIQ